LQIAFGMSHIRTDADFKNGDGPHGQDATRAPPAGTTATGFHNESIYYSNVGVMLRAYFPITAWAEITAQWDLNLLSLFDTSGKQYKEKGYVWTSPLRVGGLLNFTDRVYVRANASVN